MTKSKRNRIIIFVAALAGLLVIYLLLFYSPDKRYNWSEDYKLEKERPYGTWLVTELLQHYSPNQKFKILDEPLDHSLEKAKTPSNYIFIGQEIYLEQIYTDSLLAYVTKGNNAFIFTEGLPWILQEMLAGMDGDLLYNEYKESVIEESSTDSDYLNENNTYYFDTIFTEISNPNLDPINPYRFIYRSRFGINNKTWFHADKNNLKLLEAEALGSYFGINSELDTFGGINFYKVKYGIGAFYFHTQPLHFTNLQLLDTNSLDYTNAVFSYLNQGPVYWDEYNWIFSRPTPKTWTYLPYYAQKKEGPLKLILNSPALKWGWYLLLIFILLFVLFEGKRKQAIIAVLPDKQNSTLAHIKSLTKLYYRPDEHYPIAQKMFENFLWYLRSELRIDTSKPPEKLITEAAIKSGTEENDVKAIFDLWNKIAEWKSAKSKVFLEFYNKIDSFYSKGSFK